MFDMDLKRADLVVNAVCPGYVMTEMTKNTGFVTPDQGF
jgi:NAD(P)-dependent dehydrogenase (short-subunit alcohol dehydrogenase family)